MSRQFDAAVDVALEIERELRLLSSDKPSIRGWVSACLSRGGLVYEDVEAVKERLGGDFLQTRMVDAALTAETCAGTSPAGAKGTSRATTRSGRCILPKETALSPSWEASRRCCFALVAIVAEQGLPREAELFGGIDDIDAHRARLAELEAKRKELYARFPSRGLMATLHIGRITSDGAALITFAKAPGEIPLHPFSTAGERLIEFLLRKEHEAEAKAA